MVAAWSSREPGVGADVEEHPGNEAEGGQPRSRAVVRLGDELERDRREEDSAAEAVIEAATRSRSRTTAAATAPARSVAAMASPRTADAAAFPTSLL